MSFIGILTESKREVEVKQALKHYFDRENIKHTLIVINEKSVKNLTNVKFEILLIDMNTLENNQDLIKIIINSNKIIVNSDYDENLVPISNLKLNLISYGMNSKATFSLSSISDSEVLISLQRSIKNKRKELVEPQELKITFKGDTQNLYLNMVLVIFSIIFSKN